MLNDAEKKSIAKAKDYLIKRGICALDGSGESNVEALFLQIHRLEQENKALLEACKEAVFSMKLAELQVTGLGYCNMLSFVDTLSKLEPAIAKAERR